MPLNEYTYTPYTLCSSEVFHTKKLYTDIKFFRIYLVYNSVEFYMRFRIIDTCGRSNGSSSVAIDFFQYFHHISKKIQIIRDYASYKTLCKSRNANCGSSHNHKGKSLSRDRTERKFLRLLRVGFSPSKKNFFSTFLTDLAVRVPPTQQIVTSAGHENMCSSLS